MAACVSVVSGSCMENQLAEKVNEQGGVFCDMVTTQSTFASFKTHALDTLSPTLHLATSLTEVAYTHAHQDTEFMRYIEQGRHCLVAFVTLILLHCVCGNPCIIILYVLPGTHRFEWLAIGHIGIEVFYA